MHESEAELRALQALLDRSDAKAGLHLRSIFKPERRMSAETLVRALRGVFVLQLATVTAAGEPRVAPIDGLFYRGHLWFGVPPGAVRIHHLRARPQVSAVHARGEDLAVIAHGIVHEIEEDDPAQAGYFDYCRETYGPALWDYWQEQYRDRPGRGFTGWIEPHRLFAGLFRPEVLEEDRPDAGSGSLSGEEDDS